MKSYDPKLLTADLILVTTDGVALVVRDRPPYEGMLAIPGGKLDVPKDTRAALGKDYDTLPEDPTLLDKVMQACALRECYEEVLEGEARIVERVGIYDRNRKDPRGYVSFAYLGLMRYGSLRAGSDARRIECHKALPEKLAFDHERILRDSQVFKKYYHD